MLDYAELDVTLSIPITIRNKVTGQTITTTHHQNFGVEFTDILQNAIDQLKEGSWMEQVDDEDLMQPSMSDDPEDYELEFDFSGTELYDPDVYITETEEE